MKAMQKITPVYLNAEKVEYVAELVKAYFWLAFTGNENLIVNPEFLKKFTQKNFIEARVIISECGSMPEIKMEADEHRETIERATYLLDKKIESMTNWDK